MALTARGVEAAFATLVERYQAGVFRYFRAVCGEPEQAADLVQETFLRVHRARARFRPEGVFKRWLFVIAANLARDRRRALRRRPPPAPLEELDPASPLPTPPAAAQAAERLARIQAALRSLPPAQREALRLRLFEGLDFAAIGAALGCPPGTARTRVHYGLKALRARLGALQEDSA